MFVTSPDDLSLVRGFDDSRSNCLRLTNKEKHLRQGVCLVQSADATQQPDLQVSSTWDGSAAVQIIVCMPTALQDGHGARCSNNHTA
ncbi:hypothetical protein G6O67_000780 [Ophiocordyceps sinensis]|uniref:Uncharacterized protein n=1 Tax=Ophiocordyceps sinensis TaxID=72228 RepID=A0A8H4VAC7_9HYPO|nr:hypothetical protein G6O67_000780 [Ophiocordyceps sinensis]